MTDTTINNGMHWFIAMYGRVSTSLQEDQKTIENQLMAIRDFADQKFGIGNYTIVKEYLDEGWSGDSIKRPSLDQLRIDAGKKMWQVVLMYDPDRLARRYSYQEVVMDELQEKGIQIFFVTVPPIKDENDQMLYEMRGAFARYERTKIAERFRLGKLRKVKEGHILTSVPLYGYHYIRNNKETREHGYYTVNEEEAKVVRMIFDWVGNEGLTLRQVVLRLQKLKIKPKKSKRGVWNTSTLTTMLRHRGYIGEAHWGSSYAVVPKKPTNTEKYRQVKKSSRKIKPESEWIAPNIPVPVIVDRDLFMKVREQLKSNYDLSQRNNTKNEYLLGGKIFCSCGKKRCGEGPQHGKHLYYRCSDRIYSFPLPYTCRIRGINARIADRLVWQELTGLMTSPDRLLAGINQWRSDRKDKAQFSGVDIEAIQKEVAKLKAQVERYNTAYGAGLFSLEKLKEYTVPKNKQIVELELQILKVEQEKNNGSIVTMPVEDEIKIFSETIAETLENLNFEEKQAIIRSTVGRIIGTQKELQVSGNVPLTLNNVVYKTNDRHRRIAERGEVHAF